MKDIHLCYVNIGTFWFPFLPLPMFILHKELIKAGTVMEILALICTGFLKLFSHRNILNCCFKGKEEFCGWEQRNMKGIVPFLWEEYDNIHWQRNYEEQLSQAVSFRQCCQIFQFHEHSWACGARVRNSTAARGWVRWVPAWPAVLEVRSWNWKERKDDFLQLWDCKKKQFGKARKQSLKDAPSQTAAPQRLSLILGLRFLTQLYWLCKTFVPLPPAKNLVLCKSAS